MYNIDPQNGDIVISGFENGIGDSPYSGLTDMRSVNPISITGEASDSFATKCVFLCPNVQNNTTGSLITVGGNGFEAPISLNLEGNQYITFSNLGGATGLSINTPYLLFYWSNNGVNMIWQLYTTANVLVTITAPSTSTVTFSTLSPALPKYFQKSKGNNFMLDSNGYVWWDGLLTTGGGGGWTSATNSWTWMVNTTNAESQGNGLLLYTTVNSIAPGSQDEWLFVFSAGQIDYTPITTNNANVPIVWVYGWNPFTGTSGNASYLQGVNIANVSHAAIVTPDGRVNVCDANYILNFYQNLPTPGTSYVTFNPLSYATTYTTTAVIPAGYTNATLTGSFGGTTGFQLITFSNGAQRQVYFTNGSTNISWANPMIEIADATLLTGGTYTAHNMTAILPTTDVAQCLSFVNEYLLIGGKFNIIYPWDLNPEDNTWSNPLILLPETNIVNIVTVGNNAYIFAGNRGNIYITNGSQASLFKKLPDHLSGGVEPLYAWGGATYNKNRLYFGVNVSLQAGGNANYGGIWCLDVTTGAVWNCNELSYGSYAGYVSALGVPSSQSTYGPLIGYGLLAGWTDNAGHYGVDVSIASPYTGVQSYVISDMISIGTNLEPITPTQFEFKLATPLLAGESVKLQVASSINGSFSDLVNSSGTASTSGDGTLLSDIYSNTTQLNQWILLKCILTGISSSPSYNRLTQLRIKGATKGITGYSAPE